MTTLHFSFVAGLLIAIAGCGGPKPCVATGQVLVDGVPTEGVYVVFHTVGGTGGQADSGTTRSGSDGSFSLVVSAPGETTVNAFQPTVTEKEDETIEGPDVFRGLYSNPQRPVLKTTIQAGDNALPPIKLTRSPPG